jgi:hypothetical protein
MNEEEEKALSGDSRVRWNHLVREKHIPDLKKINTV